MRYYRIELSSGLTYTSHPGGVGSPPDPGALRVELDLFVAGAALPDAAGSWVRVWGVSLDTVGQARDLNGTFVTVYGGMGKGLPLAKPSQSGKLIKGRVKQAFANWVGTDLALNLNIVAGTPVGGVDNPVNFVLNWKAGQKLGDAVKQTLQAAYPDVNAINVNVSPNLVLPNDETAYYGTLPQFSDYVNNISRKIVGQGSMLGPWATTDDVALNEKYLGVHIIHDGDVISVTDGTTKTTPVAIAYEDLIGQPTWINYNTLQVTCVMRADVHRRTDAGFGFITLPKTRVTITQGAASQAPYINSNNSLNNVIFQGTWMVNKVHHVGDYKDPNGTSWVTILDCSSPTPLTDGQAAISTDASPASANLPSSIGATDTTSALVSGLSSMSPFPG